MSLIGYPLAKWGCAPSRRLPARPRMQPWVPSPPVPALATSGARQPGAWEGTACHWLVRGTRGGTSEGRQTLASPEAQKSCLPCPALLARRGDAM